MSLFEDLSKKVQNAAFAAADKAQEVAAAAGEKAQEVADRAKTEYAIAQEKRSMEKNYRALGEWYVSTLGEEIPEAVADIVTAIRASQVNIAALEATRGSKDDVADVEPIEVRYCPNCGEAATGRFCSKCGTEVQ